MADTENDRVKQLELQLQEAMQRISELTALTTGQRSSSTNEEQSDSMEAGLQPTDDQSCSGMVTSVASRAVGFRGEGAEGHALTVWIEFSGVLTPGTTAWRIPAAANIRSSAVLAGWLYDSKTVL